MRFFSKLQRDGDDLILILPDGLAAEMGIEEGDDLLPTAIENGMAILQLMKSTRQPPIKPS
jgi:hypothetical protein